MASLLSKIKQEPTVFLFRKAWKHTADNRLNFITYMSFTAIAHVIVLFEPLIFGELINELQENGLGVENINYVMFMVSSMLGIMLLFWVFHGPSRVIERRNAFKAQKNYRMYLLEKVFNFDLVWHSENDSGNTIDKINNAGGTLFDFCVNSYSIVNILIKFVGTIIALSFFSIWISFSVATVTILSFWILYLFDKKMILQYKEMNVFNNAISAKIFDSISNISTIVILRISKVTLLSIEKSILAPKEVWWKNTRLNEVKWFVGGTLVKLIVVIPLAFYIYNIYASGSELKIGTIGALFLYLSNYSRVFSGFSMIYGNLISQKSRIENADDIENESMLLSRKTKMTMEKSLKVSNLNFKYHAGDTDFSALKNVSLSISKGERIACIGESGSGKTTFLKVLHGLYDNAQTNIVIDGVSTKKQFHQLDLQTTLVPQEPELFSSSVTENITFSLDYTKKQIKEATDLAMFTEVATSLPNGFKSKINEKGVNLLGGQKQRLALARALLFAKDKEIILLDESTSSVDPETEVQIYKNIFSHFSGKTFLASIHKMNLLKYFDRIVVFEEGKITAEGTFSELLETNDKFRNMWEEFVKSQG